MKIKTSSLTGLALDWVVAKAEGLRVTTDGKRYWEHVNDWAGDDDFPIPGFSTDWAQGGPILSEAHISRTIDHSGLWIAYWTDGYDDSDAGKLWMQCDRSELVAGLRCYVASKLGDEVEIPEELI